MSNYLKMPLDEGGNSAPTTTTITTLATPQDDLEEGDAFDETKSLLATTTFRSRKSSSSSRAPLACNEEGFDEMEIFLQADTSNDGELTNGQTPHPSPLPGATTSRSQNTPGLRYRNLGKSGLRVSNVGLATWMLSSEDPEVAESVITLAYDSGINVFDLSEAYSGTSAEVELGKIIKKKNWRRTSFVVLTKIYWTNKCEEKGLSRKHIIESVKASLDRLQLEFIDVIVVHRADGSCPMEEVVRAMTYVINQGLAMYWGTSKWTPTEIMEAYSNCRQFNCVTPIMEQVEYHFFAREKAELYMQELYNKIGVGLMTWSPLTMSFYKTLGKQTDETMALSLRPSSFKNKYLSQYSWNEEETGSGKAEGWNRDRSISSEETYNQKKVTQQRISREIAELAEKYGCTLAQLVISWCLKNDTLHCMLIGPTTTSELIGYLQALQIIPRLTSTVMNELETILDNRPVRPPMISTLALTLSQR
ncbi:voltage-gated potassium channel subunit beta-2 isoform X1 [Folsomia candida]|uniref:voltage-gated potassium channel subunit beta-2 isoform X1 n=2 Tax=Folsomia candida TaxID=158441 RepID=UPI001604FE78|nr:voltage-gated potassium channel subunit beta-2 isoform X1 [Folsomia candida]